MTTLFKPSQRLFTLSILVVLLWLAPLAGQSEDYTYTTNNGTITITGYTGAGGAVVIPSHITGLPVASIGNSAFASCTSLTGIRIPDSVISIGGYAFSMCTNLVSSSIGNSVTSIGMYAFSRCYNLASVAIPNSVTFIDWYAFRDCTNLAAVYFLGNAPTLGTDVFLGDNNATVYYLPGTTGWGSTLGGRPTLLWNPQLQTGDGSFGVRSNGFGFTITGTTNIPIVIEAGTNITSSSWIPLQTCILTNASIYFSDSDWANHPARFYRIRSP